MHHNYMARLFKMDKTIIGIYYLLQKYWIVAHSDKWMPIVIPFKKIKNLV